MAYRDDFEVKREKYRMLAAELARIRRKMGEAALLEAREKELEAEAEKAARDLDRARGRRALPLLAQMKVASPCNEKWESMTGDEHVRHCARCDADVYDLSSLTADQAEALLRAKNGALCVRYYRRKDGTVMTADCAVGVRRRRIRNVALAATAAATVAGAGAAAFGLAATAVMGGPEPVVVMGAAPVYVPEEIVEPEVDAEGTHVTGGPIFRDDQDQDRPDETVDTLAFPSTNLSSSTGKPPAR
jgi:hypothetical protein